MASTEGMFHRPGRGKNLDSIFSVISPTIENEVQSFNVDFVIKFLYLDDNVAATSEFEQLVHSLEKMGLTCQVRPGEVQYLLVFVKMASFDHLLEKVYHSRAREWIYGVRPSPPSRDMRNSILSDPLYESEKLRVVYNLITLPEPEGGAGVTPGSAPWSHVEDIFPLHDDTANNKLLKDLSKQYFLNQTDLNAIRHRFGERVAFYFAFAQSYFTFLIFPAVIGFGAYTLLGQFSYIYALINGIWGVVFIEYWKHYEVDLATIWGVRGVSKLFRRRKGAVPDQCVAEDTVAEQNKRVISLYKRLLRQTLQVPFIIFTSFLLSTVIAGCFAIEIFLTEIYGGPLKNLLVFLPTVLLSIGLAAVKGFASLAATRLTNFENHETDAAHETSLTSKLFVVDFVVSYLPLCLTAFVYLPFANIIVPYLNVFSLTSHLRMVDISDSTSPVDISVASHPISASLPSRFRVNSERLQSQVFYFTCTAQVVHLAVSFVLPYLKRKGSRKLKNIQEERQKATAVPLSPLSPISTDLPHERKFLRRVRIQANLDTYNATDDFREMVIQFGYLSLFSVVWPLTACSFLARDWIELRADAAKIFVEMKRPIPWQSESIGPWIDALGLISWIGSIISAALVYMFSNGGLGPNGDLSTISGWKLAVCIVLAEHGYLLVRYVVRAAISQMVLPGKRNDLHRQYLTEKRFFEQSIQPKDGQPVGFNQVGEQLVEPLSTTYEAPGISPPSNFPVRQDETFISYGSNLDERMAIISPVMRSQNDSTFWRGIRDDLLTSMPLNPVISTGHDLIREHFQA